MHKIRIKYLLRMSLFIILTIGGMALIYNFFAEDFYISETKKNMNNFYQQIKEMNVNNLSEKENGILDEFVEQGFTLMIVCEEEVFYSSFSRKKSENETKTYIINDRNPYNYDATASLEYDRDYIRLRGKVAEEGKDYNIYISIKIKTLQGTISVMSKFLIIEMLIILIVSIPFSLYMANKTIIPVERISEMTKKLRNNEKIESEEYAFEDDEIGMLAKNVTDMYNEIASNMNELENYNYLLKNQNRDLIEFDERRKEFISMATHELKTPLAIVSSQLEMLNLDNEEVMSEYYDSIMEEIQKMSNLIRDMLKASFEDKLVNNPGLQRDNLSELMNKMKDRYVTWLETKHIVSKFDIEDNVYIIMNREQIEQALNNYIINAYEHTKEKGEVVVSLSQRNHKAIISVYNDGENIHENELDKIWNSFYREKKVEGNSNVGLGLYIAKDIVRYHDGNCYAKNKPGGVQFVMEFSVAEKE